jgi:N-acetyl-gamma-glutamyl-phosphate reductase common form
MTARLKVGIWGASGYAGAELIRLCLAHPHLELVHLGARRQVGERVDAVFPAFSGHLDLRFEAIDPARARGLDVLFSCLPHGASHETLAPLVGAVKLIDLSGDFRLHDPAAYEQAYAGVHPHPELLGRFVYGLPELNREALRSADGVANPGCFATACTLALLPLAKEGWLTGDVHLAAVTGSSGSGASPLDGTHHPTRSQDFYAYKVLRHQHEPEIAQTLADAGGAGFALHLVPHSAPVARGIHVTAFVTLDPALDVAAAFERHYGAEPFVRLHGDPHVLRVRGQNHCDVAWTRRGHTLVVTAAIDNLVKGASGQALQNLNLMAGFDETTGLLAPPLVV